jgi:ABC-type branched-subunit amino acid transport system substrate-binding protein
MSDLLQRLQSKRPDVILFAAEPQSCLKLQTQLQQQGTRTATIFGGQETGLAVMLADPEASNGLYLATAYMPGELTTTGQGFVKKYEDRFREPPDLYAMLSYEAARMTFDALGRVRVPLASRLREELSHQERLEGVCGQLVLSDDRTVRRLLFVVRIEDGKLTLARRYEPEAK